MWIGAPSGRLFALTGFDFLIIPFGLIFAGAALAVQALAISSGQAIEGLIALPHLLIGLYLLAGRFLVGRHYRKNMVYAVTNRRAYIASHAFSGRFLQKPLTKSVSIDYSPGTETTIRLDNAGYEMWAIPRQMFWPSHTQSFEFFRIKDGEKVIALLRQVQREQA